MKYEEIEAYIKSRDLDVMQYQLVIDAIYYAEDVIIKKAIKWLQAQVYDGMIELPEEHIERFKRAMEE